MQYIPASNHMPGLAAQTFCRIQLEQWMITRTVDLNCWLTVHPGSFKLFCVPHEVVFSNAVSISHPSIIAGHRIVSWTLEQIIIFCHLLLIAPPSGMQRGGIVVTSDCLTFLYAYIFEMVYNFLNVLSH